MHILLIDTDRLNVSPLVIYCELKQRNRQLYRHTVLHNVRVATRVHLTCDILGGRCAYQRDLLIWYLPKPWYCSSVSDIFTCCITNSFRIIICRMYWENIWNHLLKVMSAITLSFTIPIVLSVSITVSAREKTY